MQSQDPEPPIDPRADRGLVRLARGLVGDPHATEDVLQESWLVAQRNPPVDPRLRGGWLRGIVWRIALNHRRAQSREARGLPAEEAPVEALSPEDLAEREQLLETVRAAVDALDEPYRTTIRLRFLEELGYTEIAARTGRPEATLRTHVMRGLSQLRERLARTQATERRGWSSTLLAWLQRREPRA